MIDVELLYFDWLIKTRLQDTNDQTRRLAWMLHRNAFLRDVGRDQNRAIEGVSLRRAFLDDYHELDMDPSISNELMRHECSWFEMLVALSEQLDYLYEEGVKSRFIEMVDNIGLGKLVQPLVSRRNTDKFDEIDQDLVDLATNRVDHNLFDSHGRGGLFPLRYDHDHHDQREVELWNQQAAYFGERLEGGMWTSTN